MSDTDVAVIEKPVELKTLGTTHCKFDEAGHLIIPKDFTLEIAGQMFAEIRMVETKAKTTRFELIAAVVDRFGSEAARQLAAQYSNTTPGYVARVSSIVRNTKEIRQKHTNLGLNQLAVLATIADEPEKQARLADKAAEYGLNAVSLLAEINETDEETERMNYALADLQRALKVLATHSDYVHKAVNVCRQFVRDHDGRKTNRGSDEDVRGSRQAQGSHL